MKNKPVIVQNAGTILKSLKWKPTTLNLGIKEENQSKEIAKCFVKKIIEEKGGDKYNALDDNKHEFI